jgi:hypothetical protein
VLHPVAELPEARIRERREVIPETPLRTAKVSECSQKSSESAQPNPIKILHDPGAQPAMVLVFQDLREIKVVQSHMYLDSCIRLDGITI